MSSMPAQVEKRTGTEVSLFPLLPLPPPTSWQRIAKHPLLSHYNRLIALVLAANLVVLATFRDATLAGNAVLVNLALAVLVRYRHVWNGVFAVARSVPRSWPLWIRRSAAKVYHLGGLHVGAGISAAMWFGVFTADLTEGMPRSPSTRAATVLALSYVLVVLLLAICVLALSPVRRRWHNVFERSHRFLGWLVLLLFWVQTIVSNWRTTAHHSVWVAVMGVPQLWVLLLVTASVISPWTQLRKVPVSVSRPSPHAALVHLDFGWAPFNGSSAVISRSPLTEWHSFAAINVQHGDGYRIMVSRAGDWTSGFIDDPPHALWVKQVSIRGMASVETLFDRVVFVATGSGIGPTLTHLLSRPRDRPMTLVWVTRSPRQVFGDELVAEVLDLVPDALIVDTISIGKPDMVALAYHAARRFRADGVICVANQRVTRNVVYGLESRGIPACGALWDS